MNNESLLEFISTPILISCLITFMSGFFTKWNVETGIIILLISLILSIIFKMGMQIE